MMCLLKIVVIIAVTCYKNSYMCIHECIHIEFIGTIGIELLPRAADIM